LSGPWRGPWYVYNFEDFKSTITIEFYGTRHCSLLLKR
jgi:hypothetical protein